MRVKKKSTTDEDNFEKNDEKMMEITKKEPEVMPDDLLRHELDGESKKEMMYEDPTRMVVVGTDIDPKIKSTC